MCTISGVMFLMHEMMMLEKMSTTIVASPIIRPLVALVVVARVGHIPSIRTNVGFSFTMPLIMISSLLICCLLSFLGCGSCATVNACLLEGAVGLLHGTQECA